MFMSFAMLFAVLASMVLPILGVVALVTFLKRGRQFPGAGADGPYGAILDSLEQVHVRLDALSGRLTRIESHLDPEHSPDFQPPGARTRGYVADGSDEDTPAR
ncbi:MAG: hypothetical protein LJF04_11730 [Gemmatimonadetes bacterium]|nr:hypothetical protein [Gemmatimonadota bacterium]